MKKHIISLFILTLILFTSFAGSQIKANFLTSESVLPSTEVVLLQDAFAISIPWRGLDECCKKDQHSLNYFRELKDAYNASKLELIKKINDLDSVAIGFWRDVNYIDKNELTYYFVKKGSLDLFTLTIGLIKKPQNHISVKINSSSGYLDSKIEEKISEYEKFRIMQYSLVNNVKNQDPIFMKNCVRFHVSSFEGIAFRARLVYLYGNAFIDGVMPCLSKVDITTKKVNFIKWDLTTMMSDAASAKDTLLKDHKMSLDELNNSLQCYYEWQNNPVTKKGFQFRNNDGTLIKDFITSESTVIK